MTVDLSALPVIVGVHDGVDSLDVSSAFMGLSLESETIDDSGLHRLKGTLELQGFIGGYAESFDCRANQNRWKPGNIITITLGGITMPTRLKILNYPSRPTPQSPVISVPIGCDLSLFDYRQPEGASGGVSSFGTATDRTDILTAVLANHSLTLGVGQALAAYPLKYPPQKTDSSSWIGFAGHIARTANAMLWQAANGDINVTIITLDSLPITAHYTVGTNEGDFELSSFSVLPPETIKAVGTGLTLTAKNNTGDSFSETVDGVTVTTNITYSGQGTNNPSQTVDIRKPANVVAPSKTTSTTEVTDTRTTLEEQYSITAGQNGRLIRTIETIEETRMKALPNSTGFNSNLIDIRETTTEYLYAADDIVDEIQTTIRVNNSNAVLVDFQFIREKWRKKNGKYQYSRSVTTDAAFRTDNDVPQVNAPQQNKEPPATRYQPSAFEKDETEYSDEVTFQTAVTSGFGEKKQIVRMPGGLCVSDAQCTAYATIEGRLRHGRQFQVTWAAPLTSAWLTSYSPIRRVDFTLNGVRTAYLVEGFNIQSDARSTFVGGIAIELGTVNSDGTGTPTAAYTFT